ncbi:MAG: hypothetical protein PPP56_03355 [Longimonas sp.]|uniref:YncE family protein n=1 Tax=Longimonas sp. TaxID=2039626 RepID=UPI00334D8D6E
MRFRRLFLATAALLLIATLPALAIAGQNHTVDSPDAPRLYVANQGEATVSIINMDTHEVETTVDLTELGFSSNASPHHVIAEPDGSAWYVSLISENTVLKFNADNELVSQGTMEAPGLMALHPEHDQLFIARSMMAVSPPQRIGMAPRDDLAALEEVDVFLDRPHALTIPSDGAFVYSASLATNQLIGLNVETQRGQLTPLSGMTHVIVQLAPAPNGTQIVGTGQLTAQLLFFDRAGDGRLTLVDEVTVGAQPWHPVYSPDGSRIYVPNKQDNTISVVDANERTVIETIADDSFVQPHGAVLSPDGRYLYVSNNHQRQMMEEMARDMGMDAHAMEDEHGDDEHGDHGHEHHDHGDDHGHDHEHDSEHEEHDHAEHDGHDGHGHETDDRRGTISVIDTETFEVVRVIEVGVYPTGIGTQVNY